MKKKKKKWIKFRHRVIRELVYPILGAMSRIKYGARVRPFREQGKRQYLILFNHQTAFDQFFVGMAFRGPVYYLASEDLFSNGWISRLLEWAVAPIPIKKQTGDAQAVYQCLRVCREGGTIALSPEGNRTFCGKTGYIKPSVVKLVKAMKLPMALFRIEGGYGVQPRWSDVTRKGGLDAYVSRVVEPEEYKEMSDEELLALIEKELMVDEGTADRPFVHPNNAEYLERAMYVCPWCGLSELESRGDLIGCKRCGRHVRHLPTKELVGVEEPFPFRFVTQWYQHQCDYVNQLNPYDYVTEPIYQDQVSLYQVALYKKKKLLQERVQMRLYGDRIELGDRKLPFSQLQVTILGRNKLNLYFEEHPYQIKGDKRFNALKYVNMAHRYKNVSEGNEQEVFLGL